MVENIDDFYMEIYRLRNRMIADKFRPKYHFLPPQGRWNDINGATFRNGRYHLGYLQKLKNGPGKMDFSSWQHISSRDLLHWQYHEPYMDEPLEGEKGDYFNSGDAMEGGETPTIIANMPRRGICIYQCHDDNLDRWVPLPENPVIPIGSDLPECKIFDPFAWKEGDTYYMLMGNKNERPGYEGDSTSLLKSKDLRQWEYIGPFYKSDRKWTQEVEDCACADFFPFGDKHMLLMHTHHPFFKCQYYIGKYENEQFYPEVNGQLSYPGSGVYGPETLIDDKGRRIFWATIRDARNYEDAGWTAIMTLPWLFTPLEGNRLQITPVEELKQLRYDEQVIGDISLSAGDEVVLEELSSDCMEVAMSIEVRSAGQFGFKVLCSPDQEEETIVAYDAKRQAWVVDFEHASNDRSLGYAPYFRNKNPEPTEQELAKQHIVPYAWPVGSPVSLDLYVDKSVIELFVNGELCIVQRIYPMRPDSKQFRLFATDGAIAVKNIIKWEMEATNPW
ncbi:glycoside hydrolase family 32 protein [Paenibacillus koleovorans]|uniref:glycoside hydrolase family 32 protein n=1 Tax=Paenibacillus koleovorans TaxID=121608 RepID=UPI000FDB5ADD|nr:glycoside hydrolase family 32 protein [Paenibacillus koleovorans]